MTDGRLTDGRLTDGHLTDGHMAVVPISALDEHASDALDYAATLAPRVLAIHLRTVAADALEHEWASAGDRAPLVVVDAAGGDCARALRRVLDVLERSQQLRQITVVLPSRQAIDLEAWSRAADGRRVVCDPAPRRD